MDRSGRGVRASKAHPLSAWHTRWGWGAESRDDVCKPDRIRCCSRVNNSSLPGVHCRIVLSVPLLWSVSEGPKQGLQCTPSEIRTYGLDFPDLHEHHRGRHQCMDPRRIPGNRCISQRRSMEWYDTFFIFRVLDACVRHDLFGAFHAPNPLAAPCSISWIPGRLGANHLVLLGRMHCYLERCITPCYHGYLSGYCAL